MDKKCTDPEHATLYKKLNKIEETIKEITSDRDMLLKQKEQKENYVKILLEEKSLLNQEITELKGENSRIKTYLNEKHNVLESKMKEIQSIENKWTNVKVQEDLRKSQTLSDTRPELNDENTLEQSMKEKKHRFLDR